MSRWAGYGFDTDPPNVALVVREPSGATDTVVAVMTRPKVTAKGVFTARLRVLSMDQAQAVGSHLAGHVGRHDMKVPTRFTSAALFIDDVNGTYVGTSPSGCLIQAYAYCPGADLYGADMTGADLHGADMTGAGMYGADLSSADLSGANLSGADMLRANLTGANLTGANFTSAKLSDANLSGANLTGANLTGANLTGANLSEANLSGANLTGANLTDFEGFPTTTFDTTCPWGSPGPCFAI